MAYCSALLWRAVVCCYTVPMLLLLTAINHEIVCNGNGGEGGAEFMDYFGHLEPVEVDSCSVYAWPCVCSLDVILFSY